jgi:hypothetical protein
MIGASSQASDTEGGVVVVVAEVVNVVAVETDGVSAVVGAPVARGCRTA